MKTTPLQICLLFLLCPFFFFGQIKISEDLQASTIAKQTNNKLYFVDFWATWCGPCIHVSKYLTTLQKRFPNDFYIVSLTQESPQVVKIFLKKHQTELAVAIDFEGNTFKKNVVKSLPYGILYNANGRKLWEGHPAELKENHISKFLKQNRKRISLRKMFKVINYKKEELKQQYAPTDDFEYSKIQDVVEGEFQVIYKDSFIELKGTLQDILAYSHKVYKNQIKVSSEINKTYHMVFKYDTDAFRNMNSSILDALKMQQNNEVIRGEAIVFNIDKPTLWDTKQIDWGTNNERFLIGDSEIQADNVPVSEVVYNMSKLLDTPIIINGKNIDNQLHDWQLHYKYFDLMASSFRDTYGIDIEKKTTKYPQYIITKKTP